MSSPRLTYRHYGVILFLVENEIKTLEAFQTSLDFLPPKKKKGVLADLEDLIQTEVVELKNGELRVQKIKKDIPFNAAKENLSLFRLSPRLFEMDKQ